MDFVYSSVNELITGRFHFRLIGCSEELRGSLNSRPVQPGIEEISIKLESDSPISPSEIEVVWQIPGIDIQGTWYPSSYRSKRLRVDWEQGIVSKTAYSAPVISLFNTRSHNRLTFAFSDALNSVVLSAGVNEETGTFRCAVKLFTEPGQTISSYEGTLRIDTREIPYYESLNDVQQWWESLRGYTPAVVPEAAKLPVYSTWYSFHQMLSSEKIEQECLLAKRLGCQTVIVDDGWQTRDNKRGYAYCGDWEVTVDKIPDMKEHVERVHQMGMKYLLWYSVPFVGYKSKNWERFKNQMLSTNDRLETGVLDPRYPEIRDFIIELYQKALVEWNLDGFKLDFIDSFTGNAVSINKRDDGMDYYAIPEAVDRLMSDLIITLQSIKPDIMIEFRQNYIGPLMRKYGNMFRATDCPNDAIENRIRTIDVRLLSGDTAVHSDMLMWNTDEPVEVAALQFVNVLFSVPQISVTLDSLSKDHHQMVSYWLHFWQEHRDVLLNGQLKPLHPDLMYPLVIADNLQKRIVCAYGDVVLNPGKDIPSQVIFVNGTQNSRVYIELDEDMGDKTVQIRDCMGQLVDTLQINLNMGIHRFNIPPCGNAIVID